MTFKFAAGIAAAVAATVGLGSAKAESPIKFYQPTIDITKNPGCGQKLNTPAERIAHNRKLVELYYINFQKDRANGRNWSWWTWKCIAPDMGVLLGAVGALHEPTILPTSELLHGRDPNTLTGEQRGYFATFPDWGTVPNTLVVVPFDGGAYFRMMYAGTGKDDGKKYSIWETNLILVNDEGKITHFEMWNDTAALDATTRKVFGTGIADLGAGGYIEATEAFPRPAGN